MIPSPPPMFPPNYREITPPPVKKSTNIKRAAVLFALAGFIFSLLAAFAIDPIVGFAVTAFWLISAAQNLREWADETEESETQEGALKKDEKPEIENGTPVPSYLLREKDYLEDCSSGSPVYQNKCSGCRSVFLGRRGRVSCAECAGMAGSPL